MPGGRLADVDQLDAIARRSQPAEIADRLVVVEELTVRADLESENRFGRRDGGSLSAGGAGKGNADGDGCAADDRTLAGAPRHRLNSSLRYGTAGRQSSKMFGGSPPHQCVGLTPPGRRRSVSANR